MFEVKDTFDLLKGLLNILSEYEQIKDDPIDKSKIVCNIFGWAGSLVCLPSVISADISDETQQEARVGRVCHVLFRHIRNFLSDHPSHGLVSLLEVQMQFPFTSHYSPSCWITSKL